jgi:hypothetical protein
MKVKTFAALAGIGTTMILSGSANGAFIGLTLEDKPVVNGLTDFALSNGAAIPGGFPMLCCNLYANFSSAQDYLLAVFGDQADPLSISTNNETGFFQHPTAPAQGPPSAANFPFFAYQQFDTFLTIGEKTQEQNLAGNTGFSPGFPAFGPNSISGNNLAWFNTPTDTLGTPVADPNNPGQFRVLIAQLTIAGYDADDNITGEINISYNSGGQTGLEARNLTFLCGVPSPGTLALVGLAGLIGPRRRRA